MFTDFANEFILFVSQVFSFYTVIMNTSTFFENDKKKLNIFEVSIHFYYIKCEYSRQNEVLVIHLQSQLALMTVILWVPPF